MHFAICIISTACLKQAAFSLDIPDLETPVIHDLTQCFIMNVSEHVLV